MLSVPRPRIDEVRRSAAGRASVGDVARVSVGPGLLALLEHPIGGRPHALGAGYHGRYTVPLGLAITAALAIVEPATPEGGAWLGREATLEWPALAGFDETLVGEARLTALSERDALFAIAGRGERSGEVLRGQFLLVAVAGGRPVGASGATSLTDRARERRAVASPPPAARIRSAPTTLPLGRSGEVVVELIARGTWTLTACAPAAAGLSVEPPATLTVAVAPGSSATATFTVRADRADAVNSGRPWTLEIRATTGGHDESLVASIAVPDHDSPLASGPLDLTDLTTPALAAWTAPEPCAVDRERRTLCFPVRLLGRGIRVDTVHPVEVKIAPPGTVDGAAVTGVSVRQGDRVLASGRGALTVTLTDRETPIDLEVELTPTGLTDLEARRAAAGGPFLVERSEPARPDLFRLRPPSALGPPGAYRVWPDVARLLMNLLAGGSEPLGRRMHPLSGLGVGASLTAAFGLAGHPTPAEPSGTRAAALWIRWLALSDLALGFETRGRVQSSDDQAHTVSVEVFDTTGRQVTESEAVVVGAPASPGPAVAELLARRRIDRTPPPAAGTLRQLRTRLGGLLQRLSAGRGTPGT